MKIDARNIIVLTHPNGKEFLLLRRSPTKKLFPNLITGIGGAVELSEGEGNDLTNAMWRELTEETNIHKDFVESITLRLITTVQRSDEVIVLLWYKGILTAVPQDLSCTEGTLNFYPISELSQLKYIPTAKEPIQLLAKLTNRAEDIMTAVYTSDFKLVGI